MLSVSGLNYHLNVWDGGGETTVLLLHGYLDVGMTWSFMVDELGPIDWHIVAPDWRGHGDSDWIGAGGYYHFTDYVRDLEQIVRQVRRERLIVVGHSMGAMVASLWAGIEPTSLDGLMLVEGLGPVPVTEADYPQRMRRWLEQTAPYDAEGRDRPMKGLAHAESRLSRAFPRQKGEVVKAMTKFATRVSDDGLLRWKYDPLLTTNSPMPTLPAIALEFWRRVTCPVQWIGGQDSQWSGSRVSTWLDHVAGVERRILPGIGHMVQNEGSVELASELKSFMVRIPD